MSMDIQHIGLLSNEELDAVAGGMMNNGQGQFLQTQPKNGGPANDPTDKEKFGAGCILTALVLLSPLGF
jgi:hypothetical protein